MNEKDLNLYMVSIGDDDFLLPSILRLEEFIERIDELDWLRLPENYCLIASNMGWQKPIGTVTLRTSEIRSVMIYPHEQAKKYGIKFEMISEPQMNSDIDVEVPDTIPDWMSGGDAPA